jgi:hypothetical protein
MPEDELEYQSDDESLLQEIRDRYRYASDAWREAREERKIDMRYLCGDPWDEEDRKARKDAGRPCINHDELNQYINQGVNNLRQNKRGIKIEPYGNGANDKTAELRQDLVRTIEYRSKAQSAYLRAGQDLFEGSYGFFRITLKYVSNDSDDQEIVIKPIPNPDSVLYDPDCKEPDWSDAGWCFVVEPISKEEFKRRWPKAKKIDFSPEDCRVAKDWIQDRVILVAEYWKVVVTERQGKTGRMVEDKSLIQYFTNGLEILDERPQPGEEIPIPSMVGLERYVDEGSGPKRKLFSLARLARDPQMSLAYLNSQEMEEAGLTPKTSWVGAKGQFESDSEAWETAHKIPHPFLQYDPMPDGSGGQLPPPQRAQFTPNFQQYEIAKDSARRAIQAAMGISPLPTAAQRNNEKSGVALERVQTEQAIGSYHFVDGFDRAVERAGRIIDSWIPVVYDTEREMGLQRADDSRRQVRLNTSEPYLNDKGEAQHFPIGEEDHDVTVSSGPSMQSQREAEDAFLDTLISNLKGLPLAPAQAAKLLALAIKMKDLGPIADQMADIVSPPDQGQQMPPQAQQAIQQAQQHMQAMNAYAQKLEAEIQQLKLEQQAKVIETQGRKEIEQMKIEAQITAAEITTKAQDLGQRLDLVMDMMKQFHVQAHEHGLQVEAQAHQQQIAQQQQEAAAAQSQAPAPNAENGDSTEQQAA